MWARQLFGDPPVFQTHTKAGCLNPCAVAVSVLTAYDFRQWPGAETVPAQSQAQMAYGPHPATSSLLKKATSHPSAERGFGGQCLGCQHGFWLKGLHVRGQKYSSFGVKTAFKKTGSLQYARFSRSLKAGKLGF